jgi:hypothetical protein
MHLRSKQHIDVIRLKMQEKDRKREPELKRNMWTCKICFATCDIKDMRDHILGENHGKVIASHMAAARTAWTDTGSSCALGGEDETESERSDDEATLVESGKEQIAMAENGNDEMTEEKGEEGDLGGDVAEDVDAYLAAEAEQARAGSLAVPASA